MKARIQSAIAAAVKAARSIGRKAKRGDIEPQRDFALWPCPECKRYSIREACHGNARPSYCVRCGWGMDPETVGING